MRAALARLEAMTGKRFGDAGNPLLVSCRSGAKFSMPGMMDTVLNIGLNDEVAEGIERLTGDARFAFDSYRRLVQMFGSVVMGVADEPFEEVLTEARKRAGVASDSDLGADDWRRVTARVQGDRRRATAGRDFPQDPMRADPARHRGGLPVLERQARRRLPQRRQDRPRPRHRGQHLHHGLRQPRRRLGDRRRDDAQRRDRRAAASRATT